MRTLRSEAGGARKGGGLLMRAKNQVGAACKRLGRNACRVS